MKRQKKIKLTLFYFIISIIMGYLIATGGSHASDMDDTMLMFVGEDLETVTVASRTPESPSTAPAVVSVVDHNDIVNYGYKTLAEVLSAQPGFYISDQGTGSMPYVRGISNGILVLYDGVPVPTGGVRNYYSLDHELSLNSVKRIEIIRGPGSVLWGADAFAGIVNIVPFTGKDFAPESVEEKSGKKKYAGDGRAEVTAGSNHAFSGFADRGYNGRNWDAYLSVYGAQNRYDNGSLQTITHAGDDWIVSDETIDDSEYREVTANFNLNDSFSISGRFSDFNKSYTQTVVNTTNLGWSSEKKVPSNQIKANYSTAWGSSHWNLTTYYQDISYEQMDAGDSIPEKLNIFYGELLWDRRLFTKGLITAGLSYRENHVEDESANNGFMPDYLFAEYGLFTPITNYSNYKNTLISLFSQYRHPFEWGEFWTGFRFDDNSMYEDYAPSYTLGINIPLNGGWRVKTAFGTGYRTPYTLQQWSDEDDLLTKEETLLTRDEVATLNLQAEWSSGQGDLFSATMYRSHLSKNVQSDPYAGLSDPSDQNFSGLELFVKKKIKDRFEAYCSLSKVFYSGDEYDLRAYSFSYFGEDGTRVDIYDTWSESYDPGADFIASSGLTWHLHPNMDFALTACWTAPIPYSYKENTITGEYDNPLLLNSELRIKLIPYKNILFSVGCKNILDGDFTYPGFYGPVNGSPLTGYAAVRFSF